MTNIAILSAAGTGKSWQVKEWEKDWIKEGRQYAILAATGIAALSIGGTTVHRFFGIGLGKGTAEQLLASARKHTGLTKKIREIEIIVIDEISMISGELLEKLDYMCKEIRRCYESFGGIQMIITGDFMQLAPVVGSFAFQSNVWDEMNLDIQIRPEAKRFDDNSFAKMLARARMGFIKRKDAARLQSRYKAYQDGEHLARAIKPTVLYSHRADVETINAAELAKIDGKEWKYMCQDVGTSTLLDNAAPSCLVLKIGAQVMCTSNLSLEDGIVNGSRGIVRGCNLTTVAVEFLNGKIIDIGTYEWEIEPDSSSDQNRKRTVRRQIPLMLAWATTIHKSQSLTMDYIIVSLSSKVFSAGQAYVALSRVRNYASLFLSDFVESSIFCSLIAKRFYDGLGEETSET